MATEVINFREQVAAGLFNSQIERVSNELQLDEQQKEQLRMLIEEKTGYLRPIIADVVLTHRTRVAELLRAQGTFRSLLQEIHKQSEATLKILLSAEQFHRLRKMREPLRCAIRM
jgi:hypothetical protein